MSTNPSSSTRHWPALALAAALTLAAVGPLWITLREFRAEYARNVDVDARRVELLEREAAHRRESTATTWSSGGESVSYQTERLPAESLREWLEQHRVGVLTRREVDAAVATPLDSNR